MRYIIDCACLNCKYNRDGDCIYESNKEGLDEILSIDSNGYCLGKELN
jgi:hypothetical protein